MATKVRKDTFLALLELTCDKAVLIRGTYPWLAMEDGVLVAHSSATTLCWHTPHR